jgi:UDP-sugar pyrophosphorylase
MMQHEEQQSDFHFCRTINVEYNQLDPLLRATGSPNGDVNDEETGYSPFPGNINQLLFQLDGYHKALERTKGIMPEFVNPKYKDESKTVFKKPTRLECMMQDFPTVLEGEDAKKVGYTSVPADLCFSPVKNATPDGVALQAQGIAPGTAATGERDQYGAFRKMLRSIGCRVEQGDKENHLGIDVDLLPAVVLDPSSLTCPGELKNLFPHPDKVKISKRSTLIVRGDAVVIESLDLDGAMVIQGKSDELITINKEVKNEGWIFDRDETSDDEVIKMRGYQIARKETDEGL